MIEFRHAILELFQCKQSGNCCQCSGYVYVKDSDIQSMSTQLGMSVNEFKQRYVRQARGWRFIAAPDFRSRCFLNLDQQCQVYESRPTSCRSYPNWDSIWQSDVALSQEAESCPGLKEAIIKFNKKRS